MEVLEKEAIDDLFRFALLLTGKRTQALEVVSEALGQAEVRAAQFRAERSRWIWTARWVWEALRKRIAGVDYGQDLDLKLSAFFQGLLPKDRAALALRAMSHLEIIEIGQILNQRPKELRKLLARLFDERQALGCDELVLRDGVVALGPTSDERSALLSAKISKQGGRSGTLERVFGVTAVVFGVTFIFGFFFWERWKSEQSSPLFDQVGRLLEFNEASNRAEFEPFDSKNTQLSDWLYLHGIEAVHVPSPYDKLKLVAGRVGQWRGMEVAQLVSDSPKSVLLVADTAGFSNEGAAIRASELSAHGWSVRWVVSGRHLVLFGVPGAASELQSVFEGLENQARQGN